MADSHANRFQAVMAVTSVEGHHDCAVGEKLHARIGVRTVYIIGLPLVLDLEGCYRPRPRERLGAGDRDAAPGVQVARSAGYPATVTLWAWHLWATGFGPVVAVTGGRRSACENSGAASGDCGALCAAGALLC